jgi:hypothetical protein
MGRTTEPTWKNDWNAFTEFLEMQLQGGATQNDLASSFGGCEVCWAGTIENVEIDELSAGVDVLLDERIVTLQNGSEVILDGLSLSLAEESTDKWQSFTAGDLVSFTAILGNLASPFSPIEVKTLGSGKSIIMIRLSNALPA